MYRLRKDEFDMYLLFQPSPLRQITNRKFVMSAKPCATASTSNHLASLTQLH